MMRKWPLVFGPERFIDWVKRSVSDESTKRAVPPYVGSLQVKANCLILQLDLITSLCAMVGATIVVFRIFLGAMHLGGFNQAVTYLIRRRKMCWDFPM